MSRADRDAVDERRGREFWEQRLASDWTLSGVGYRALGRPFNTWMYRVRREVFLREVTALGLDLSNSAVLDLGSGTGFYLDLWRQLGAGHLVGSDLTDAAVARLRERFPDLAVHRIDLTEPVASLPPASFDVVSCLDVLFHITDDNGYRTAIDNIARLVRPGGTVVLSENFVHRPEERGPRQVNRRLEQIERILRDRGLLPQRRTPMFVLMNAQVDAGPMRRRVWGGILRAVTLTPPTGWLAGAALYPVERRLVRRLSEGPSTELLVCRRADVS